MRHPWGDRGVQLIGIILAWLALAVAWLAAAPSALAATEVVRLSDAARDPRVLAALALLVVAAWLGIGAPQARRRPALGMHGREAISPPRARPPVRPVRSYSPNAVASRRRRPSRKTAPPAGRSSAERRPPMAATSRRATNRPIPAPGTWPVRGAR